MAFLCFTFFLRHFCFTVGHVCFVLMHLCLFVDACVCIYNIYTYACACVYVRSSNPVFTVTLQQLMSCIEALLVCESCVHICACMREGAAMGYLLAPWRLDNCRCLFHLRARTLTHTHTQRQCTHTLKVCGHSASHNGSQSRITQIQTTLKDQCTQSYSYTIVWGPGHVMCWVNHALSCHHGALEQDTQCSVSVRGNNGAVSTHRAVWNKVVTQVAQIQCVTNVKAKRRNTNPLFLHLHRPHLLHLPHCVESSNLIYLDCF